MFQFVRQKVLPWRFVFAKLSAKLELLVLKETEVVMIASDSVLVLPMRQPKSFARLGFSWEGNVAGELVCSPCYRFVPFPFLEVVAVFHLQGTGLEE